tara:strand:+ start:6537 stop:9089 length:2553 start_codon:yes stop_codon:yes gene_type:complete
MPTAKKPILIFPTPASISRSTLSRVPSTRTFPSAGRQSERLGSKFQTLLDVFESQNVQLSTTSSSIEPEKVLVLETVGSIDNLMNAVAKVDGLEWLVESGMEGAEPDEDFGWNESDKLSKLERKMYMMMANKRGAEEFVSLWATYLKNPELSFERGFNKFRDVFKQLKDIRFWGAQDRIEEGYLLKDWLERIEEGTETVSLQIELWYRDSADARTVAEAEVTSLVEELGGSVVSKCVIEDILYHGILVSLSLIQARNLLENPNISLLKSEKVMFIKSSPQSNNVCELSDLDDGIVSKFETVEDLGEAKVALLDGLPIENHKLLRGRLRVDDWDSWGGETATKSRRHGTNMASTIIFGDLSSNQEPLNSRLLVMPILKSTYNEDFNFVIEEPPFDLLEVDLIHRLVKRIVDNHPSVKIINLSYGDLGRLYYHSISPLARLIDWLSFKFDLTFFISSGNHFDMDRVDDNDDEINNLIFKIHKNVLNRKICSPAESINAITVGSTNFDFSNYSPSGDVQDILSNPFYPSPFSACGLGVKSSVKPDICFPGGKVFYRKSLIEDGLLEPFGTSSSNSSPGIKAATCSSSGSLSNIGYFHGTSFSCALASRLGCQIHDAIAEVFKENQLSIPDGFHASLIKSLIVHGASWGDAKEKIFNIFHSRNAVENRQQIKYALSRFLGYGLSDPEKSLYSTESRVMVIGYGEVGKDKAAKFLLPLPTALNGLKAKKKLTITLSWLADTNPKDKRYRVSQLWFDNPIGEESGQDFGFSRKEAEYRMARRGTIQHDIYESDDAISFLDNEQINITVNCKRDGGNVLSPVKFCLVASLEVEPKLGLNIHEQIEESIREKVITSPF